MNWHRAARVDEIPEECVLGVNVSGVSIALYQLQSGIYATHNICTHAYACLSDGFVDDEDEQVECPLHQGIFHVPTGNIVSGPLEENLKTYPVRVVDSDIYISLDEQS